MPSTPRRVAPAAERGEALQLRERADVLAPVGAVEQVAVEVRAGLPPLLLLHHRHRAVGLRAARVQALLPGAQSLRRQQEGGPLLDGGLGLDDAFADPVEVARARVVARVARLERLLLLQLLTELLQQLLHAGYFGFEIGYGRGAADDGRRRGQQGDASEQRRQQQQRRWRSRMLRSEGHVVYINVARLLPSRPLCPLPTLKWIVEIIHLGSGFYLV